ncbi:MAG: SixA phosphatase family protein [Ilumatobacteraceae bacterium]
MRRHLLLVRHAKSSWDDPAMADHDRPLSSRGQEALALMRGHLAGGANRPDLVLCSSARRAVDTLDGLRPALGEGALIEVDPALYEMTDRGLLGRLQGLDEPACAMVVAHNPYLQMLASSLAGHGDAEARQQVGVKFPTGAIVTLSFDGEWADLEPGVASADDLFMPRAPRS